MMPGHRRTDVLIQPPGCEGLMVLRLHGATARASRQAAAMEVAANALQRTSGRAAQVIVRALVTSRARRALGAMLLLLVAAGCGGDSPIGPSDPKGLRLTNMTMSWARMQGSDLTHYRLCGSVGPSPGASEEIVIRAWEITIYGAEGGTLFTWTDPFFAGDRSVWESRGALTGRPIRSQDVQAAPATGFESPISVVAAASSK